MAISTYTFLVIVGCAVVTWVPRVVPFIFVSRINLPEMVMRYLSYVPLCILTALFVESILIPHEGGFPTINWSPFFASLPTIVIAILTKSLLWIVVVGVVSMAIVRFMGV